MQGKIKMYNEVKGYGFIKGVDGKDYFFHCSSIEENQYEVQQGANVEFLASQNNKGYEAKKIHIKNTAAFISLDGERVRLSNIRNYTTSEDEEKRPYPSSDGEALAYLLKDFGLFGGNSKPRKFYHLRVEMYNGYVYVVTSEDEREIKELVNKLDLYFGV